MRGRDLLPSRPLIYRLGKKARQFMDRVIASGSLIPTDPLFDDETFEWTSRLRAEWESILAEAQGLLSNLGEVPPLRLVSPDHRRIMLEDSWRSFFLWGYGYKVEENCRRCPKTAALVESIPGLNSAFFSILMPGTHIRSHRGPTKALVTCHLGLMVPSEGGCRMTLAGHELGWREGEWLMFDDTYRHEVWNDTSDPRIVLLLQVRRPVRGAGKVMADFFLGGIRRSPFVQEGRRNIAAWHANLNAGDVAA
jgi:beta-hydroxylase